MRLLHTGTDLFGDRHGHGGEAWGAEHVSSDLGADVILTRDELQERMSGNLCRCGAHNGIIDAIRETMAAETAA